MSQATFLHVGASGNWSNERYQYTVRNHSLLKWVNGLVKVINILALAKLTYWSSVMVSGNTPYHAQ